MKKTNICLVCLKSKTNEFIDIFFLNNCCSKCYHQFCVTYKNERVDGINHLSIYKYNDFMRRMLFNLKGLNDIELAPIFLERHLLYLKLRYRKFVLVPAPSTKESDLKRGFNHVTEIFKSLKLEFIPLINKKSNFKQSDLSFFERQKIKEKLVVTDGERITNKRVLIVDDVRTSGATIKAIIALIKSFNPKHIEILTISATTLDT